MSPKERSAIGVGMRPTVSASPAYTSGTRADPANMAEYHVDPSLTDVPMNLAEIEEYVNGDLRQFCRDSRKLAHFLGRVVATIVVHKEQIRSLHSDINALQTASQRVGAATTMAPRDAVRYLSPDELASVVQGTYAQQMNHVLRLRAEAESAQRDAVAKRSQLEFALLGLLDDRTIPDDVRSRLRQAFDQLPADPHPASTEPDGQSSAPVDPTDDPVRILEELFSPTDRSIT
jgi:hypothetical protein